MFIAGQRIWDENMIIIFQNVYQMLNNNRKIMQMQKKKSNNFLDSFVCNKVSPPNQIIQDFKIPRKILQKIHENYKNYTQFKKVNNNQSQNILKQINFFINMEQNQINFNEKWYSIRKLINCSLNLYPNQDIHLQYYVQKYLEALQNFQCYQKKKIQLFRNLPLNVRISKFIVSKIPSKCFRKVSFQKSLKNYDQNEFWQEIQRQSILQQYYYFLLLLLSNQTVIQNKTIIFNAWQIFEQKIKQLFRGINEQSLSYFELVCTIKQFDYSLKLKALNKCQDLNLCLDVEEAKNSFLNSVQKYFNEATEKNIQFAYKMKTSKFFMDLLIKVYDGTITIKNYPKYKAKQKLIELFYYLIDKDQSYMFLTQNRIQEQFLDLIIRFIIEKQTQNLNIGQQIELQKNKIRNQSILQKLLFEVGSFAQKYPCSNYSKIIMKMGLCFSKNLLNIFIKNSLNHNELFFRIQIATKQILDKKILKFIKKNSLNQLIVLYLLILDTFFDKSDLVLNSMKKQNLSLSKDFRQIKETSFDKMFKKALTTNLNEIAFEKIQYSAKVLSIELFNKIVLRASFENQPKYFYRFLKYFRSFRNTEFQNPNNFEVFKRQKRNKTYFFTLGTKTFQKKFKKQFYELIIEKSTFKKNKLKCIFLQKIKDKIIERLAISVIENDCKK